MEKTVCKGGSPAVRIVKIVSCVIGAAVILFALLIAFLSVTEYKPEDIIPLEISGSSSKQLTAGDTFSVLTWNIGYGALGENADFFMDGGHSVNTADKELVESNMTGIREEILKEDPDILFIQEIDRDSSRSHHIDQYLDMQSSLTGYSGSFANNFKVSFLPYPVPPIGKVDSGVATFSRFGAGSAERLQLPIPFKWPVSMANLKRCLQISRIPVEGSAGELVLINLHLEAYDKGEGKIAQTKMLAGILNEEYKKGNYVIAGGDFNQIFSSEREDSFPLQDGMWHPGVIDVTGIEGAWSFLMDETVPSCRSLDRPYKGADEETFQFYLIDGFIVSGNIKVNTFMNQDLGFECSDHNPVYLKATLH